jgi:DNA (cytosine-5)-methyltransferase 1
MIPGTCPVCGFTGEVLGDFYSGAGGAGTGYARAGWHVFGVDQQAQPRYPYCFWQGEALAAIAKITTGEWKISGCHGSPPCQDHMRHPFPNQPRHGSGWLLAATRDAFTATGLPWVIENVPGSPMRRDVVLCGCLIGRPQVKRVRWFEVSWPVDLGVPKCNHRGHLIMNTVRGGGPAYPGGPQRSPWTRVHGRRARYAEIAEALGVEWMRGREVTQAVPPGYTEILGEMMLAVARAGASPTRGGAGAGTV